jgi:2-keto-4-pentenoate hydratase/2-oxohepta-3-ene-1,7-dioic acid hydratase in catechol pathway
MIPVVQLAVFYFSNHQAVIRPGARWRKDQPGAHYELEIGCVVSRGGATRSSRPARTSPATA